VFVERLDQPLQFVGREIALALDLGIALDAARRVARTLRAHFPADCEIEHFA
jgi:hypothetical protein